MIKIHQKNRGILLLKEIKIPILTILSPLSLTLIIKPKKSRETILKIAQKIKSHSKTRKNPLLNQFHSPLLQNQQIKITAPPTSIPQNSPLKIQQLQIQHKRLILPLIFTMVALVLQPVRTYQGNIS